MRKLRTKKYFMKTLAFTLAIIMMSWNVSVIANAESGNSTTTNDVRSLTYEEYILQKQMEAQYNGVSAVKQSVSEGNSMKSTTELSEGKDNIICENVDELEPLTNIQLTGSASCVAVGFF